MGIENPKSVQGVLYVGTKYVRSMYVNMHVLPAIALG